MMYLIATTMMELIYTIKKGRGGYPSRPIVEGGRLF